MPARLMAFGHAATDPVELGRFWAGVLGRELFEGPDGVILTPLDPLDVPIRFLPTDQPHTEPNQFHPDLTSTSPDDQQARVATALQLGGRHLDIGQGDVDHVVLADPEGDEFCVIEPGNSFLEGCGLVGALAGDGSQAVGYFWSQALDWPLVWDQDEETAIQSPDGGTKLTWGGPPLETRSSRSRIHLELESDDVESTVNRLIGLGAARLDERFCDDSRVGMTDPDGNPFCIGPPQQRLVSEEQ